MPTADYGTWASPIAAEALVSTVVGLSGVRVDGEQLYWLESHPEQGGRVGLWRQPLGGGGPARDHAGPGLRPQPGVRVRRR